MTESFNINPQEQQGTAEAVIPPEPPSIPERQKEVKEAAFKSAAEELTQKGLRYMVRLHDEKTPRPETLHVRKHPEGMLEWATPLMEILHLTPEERGLTAMGIAWHDTVIEFDHADPEKILAMIERHRGAREGDQPKESKGNEAESARLLIYEMRRVNERLRAVGKEKIFSEEDMRIAEWEIAATYPDVDMGPDFKGASFAEYSYYEIALEQNPALKELFAELKEQGVTKGPFFFQPHLEKPLEEGEGVPRGVLITALADLRAAGSASAEKFFKEGDDEMRELYENLRQPDVMRRLRGGDEDRDRDDREKVMQAFVKWLESQAGFAAWQALRFEKIMYLLKRHDRISREEEEGMRSQSSHYIDNIRATLARAKELKARVEDIKADAGEREAFLYLARSLHYEI
jgi:hypothetical protein